MSPPSVPSVRLSLRLLKVSNAADALRDDHELRRMESEVGELWVGQSEAEPPRWTTFLSPIAPAVPAELRTQTCSAILFVETANPSKRLFALCFGQGHHWIDESSIERGFGLKVTLNQVSRDRLRTIDSATLDTTVMQRRTQASRDADLGDFEINTDRDLVRLAAGSPASNDFASALAGRDVLNLRGPIAPQGIVTFCEKALRIYRGKEYRQHFKFIDHVQSVADPKLREKLDQEAFRELGALVGGGVSDLHLTLPDILTPEKSVEVAYYGKALPMGRKTTYADIAIEDYVSELKSGQFPSIQDMKEIRESHEICVVKDGEADRRHRRKLYSCLVFETQHAGKTYVLFDAQWYLVDPAYHAEVERYYQRLVKTPFQKETKAKNEKQFLKELLADKGLLCLDQTEAAPAGAGRAQIEPCDFLSLTKQLIHIKDGHGSAPLSHLWNQGLVSTESFVRDAKFRRDFRRAVTKREKELKRTGFLRLIPDGRSKPIPSQFKIVFGVMRHPYARSKKLGIPFFSKIALRAVAQRLELMGFAVELHLIKKV